MTRLMSRLMSHFAGRKQRMTMSCCKPVKRPPLWDGFFKLSATTLSGLNQLCCSAHTLLNYLTYENQQRSHIPTRVKVLFPLPLKTHICHFDTFRDCDRCSMQLIKARVGRPDIPLTSHPSVLLLSITPAMSTWAHSTTFSSVAPSFS